VPTATSPENSRERYRRYGGSTTQSQVSGTTKALCMPCGEILAGLCLSSLLCSPYTWLSLVASESDMAFLVETITVVQGQI